MQFIVSINQQKALEWGLKAPQAMLFAFLHQVPTWARSRQFDGATWFNVSKGKIVEELPLLTDKQDMAYRLMTQIRDAGLIEMTSCDNRTYIRLTAKALEWNRTGSEKSPTPDAGGAGSEKNPTLGGKSEQGRKNIRGGSENSPTNQDTNINNPSLTDASEPASDDQPPADPFDRFRGFDDSGQPLDTASHPMTEDWEPDLDTIVTLLTADRRMTAEQAHDLLRNQGVEALARFRTKYLAMPGRSYESRIWQRHFADYLAAWQRNLARQPSNPKPNTGGHHANRSQRPRQYQSAAEARAAAQSGGQRVGDTFDGQWSPGER